ncbi:MAG: DNA repair protein RecN [Candidatus Aegiribacteria sp.]|nr:DNA repair protein RecN [Candidatus Aegiribacteria sp.]
MLTCLTLRNLATISDTTLEFDTDLNVLTGETGAGKSILIDGMLLTLGERADTGLVRPGTGLASVEAVFLNRDGSELLIRREIRAGGRSRIFINDELTTLDEARRRVSGIVDLHSQRSTPALLVRRVQQTAFDEFGGNFNLAGDLSDMFEEYRSLLQRLNDLQGNHEKNLESGNLIRHELSLIEKLNPSLEDYQSLVSERKELIASQNSAETLHGIVNAISGDDGIITALGRFQNELSHTDIELHETIELIGQAEISLTETSSSCSAILGRIDSAPWRLKEIDDRLDGYSELLGRCGGSLDRLLQRRKALEEEQEKYETIERELQDLEVMVPGKGKKLHETAEQLSTARESTVKKLQNCVQKELRLLGMPDAVFSVIMHDPPLNRSLTSDGKTICSDGYEIPEFYFSANKGIEPGPLASVASGGELSRVSLVLKLALVSVSQASTMVFDEIDSGIGGETANLLADSLKRASENRQVIVITHLAQIASKAGRHLAVSKELHDGMPSTRVKELKDKQNRVAELARLLGGGDAAIEHAEKMLGGFRSSSAEDGDGS